MATNSRQRERERRQREAVRAQRERDRFAKEQERKAERERKQAERAEVQADRERRELYVTERQTEAEERTAALTSRVEALETILTAGARRPTTPDLPAMRGTFVPAPFDLGDLGTPEPEPAWERFAPRRPGFFASVFGRAEDHARAEQEARLRFEQEQTAHRQREQHRREELQHAHVRHQRDQAAERQRVEAHNASVQQFREAFQNGQQDAVETCLRATLQARTMPEGVSKSVQVAYRPDSRQVLVRRDLPDTDIVPTEVSFRYVKTRDAIEASRRKPAEVRGLYADVIAQLALLALHDVFTATTSAQVGEAAVNCHLSTTERATGQAIEPCLLSVTATREQFEDLVLDKLEPRDCLRHLNALVSPHPYDVEPVKPIFDPDLSRFRTVAAQDIAAGLDSRAVLTEQSPTEFEHLVRQLFEEMGMQSWVTQACHDEGVDAIAYNPDPIMGGVCVVQAKRYTNTVPVEAVRALWGVMEDKKAGRGVLVTTSHFTKGTYDFAARNERVQLIEGPHLVYLIGQYLHLDVLTGAKQPPRARG
jgi:restriction system protein